MAAKAANMGPELMRFIEKSLLLQVLDAVWKDTFTRWIICVRALGCARMVNVIR